jgi:hypothetical protein
MSDSETGPSELGRGTKADSIHIILSGMVFVALLTWGSYAILAVSTSPSDQGSTDAALRGVRIASSYAGNGTIIRPNSQAQFMMVYQDKVIVNASQPWPRTYSVPGGEGYGFGPFLTTQPSSNFSSFEVRYAIFTFSFSAPGPLPPQGQPAPWFSGPHGNLSQPTYGFGSLALSNSASLTTWILGIDSAGNYTLHYSNAQSANATGKVIMSSSSVVFSRSRPYLYSGLATVVTGAAFLTSFALLRKLKRTPVRPDPMKEAAQQV